jgi:hypothetical protein
MESNTLRVAGSLNEDEWIYNIPIVYLNDDTMKKYFLKANDYIRLYSWSKNVIGKVLLDNTIPEHCVRLNAVQRKNLNVTIGSVVKFKQIYEIPMCKELILLPLKGNLTELVEDSLRLLRAPLCKGNVFYIKSGGGAYVKFKVVNMKHSRFGFITRETKIRVYEKKIPVVESIAINTVEPDIEYPVFEDVIMDEVFIPPNEIEAVEEFEYLPILHNKHEETLVTNSTGSNIAQWMERLIIPIVLMIIQFAAFRMFYRQ